MRIRKDKKTNTKKIVAIIVVIILLLTAGYAVFAYASHMWPFPQIASTPTTNAPTNSDTSTQGSKEDIDPNNSSNQTTDQIPVSDTLTATITTLNQANGVVTFNGSVNSEAANGKCTITFSNPNDKPVARTVDAVMSGGSSVCGPVQIPENEFSYLGTWSATFRYFNDNTQAIATKDITIQ
jgi:flagellar basal body-associated protein FliL